MKFSKCNSHEQTKIYIGLILSCCDAALIDSLIYGKDPVLHSKMLTYKCSSCFKSTKTCSY